MIGRLIRLLLGVLLGFAGVFAVLAAVNFSDQDLTPDAKALLAPQAAATPPEQNGFFLYAGLTAPPGEDAHKWGQARIAVLKRAAERKDTTSPEYRNALSRSISCCSSRRASAALAAKKLGPAEVPAFLAQSPPELADPHTGKPMQWDAAERRLFFASRQLAGVGWMPERLGKAKGKVMVKVP